MTDLAEILQHSSFLALCRQLQNPEKYIFGDKKLRFLFKNEINQLLAQGNYAPDWTQIRVVEDFSPGGIFGCLFFGVCTLGRFEAEKPLGEDQDFPQGLYYSTLRNVIIGDGALVHRCEFVSEFIIDNACLVRNSLLSGKGLSTIFSNLHPSEKEKIFGDGGLQKTTPFGNGIWINAGIETGGREVPLFADLNSMLAEKSARSAKASQDRKNLDEFLIEYTGLANLPMGYLGKNSSLIATQAVKDSFIGSDVRIEGASRIDGCTIIGNEKSPVFIGSGCILESSILRPGSRLDSQAIVSRSFIAEAARAEKQAKITESFIGPNSLVEVGEVTASFLGPFVASHHQSLLIAAYWPDGRGNLGHGANVGSNHSSRAPDGEIWPAEGMFFGLGCNIQYPADFSHSPYTIVATGLSTLPQKLEYPFSLLVQADSCLDEIPSAFNRLIPAWVLRENLYAVRRSEMKFTARNRVPDTIFDSDPFKPDTIGLMKKAVTALEDIDSVKSVYLPEDVPGLGKNFLLEKDRLGALETYTFFIRLIHLRNLLASCDSPNWRVPPNESLPDLITEYSAMLEKYFFLIQQSRRKDHIRGARIIPDYRSTHTPLEKDDVIIRTREFLTREIDRIKKIGGQE